MRLKVPFLGVSTQSNYEEGECIAMLNARPSKGVYKPVSPQKVMQTLSERYDIVFVHRGNNYENWIGVIGESIYTNIKDAPNLIATLSEIVNSVQQVGNTLSFVTSSDIYYALYKNTGYVYLGQLPEMISLKFNTTDMVNFSEKFVSEYGEGGTTLENIDKHCKGLANKIVSENKDYYFDSYLVRYAYKLYDGSLVKHSPPILIMPKKHYLDWKTIFLSKSEHDPVNDKSTVNILGYKINVEIDFYHIYKWKDIIKSVDLFFSQPLGIASNEDINFNYTGRLGVNDITLRLIQLYDRTTSGALKRLVNYSDRINECSNFYYYTSLKFAPYYGRTFPDNDVSTKDMQNIKYQKLMENDDFSHHHYGASQGLVFNKRLRISDLKTILYRGFHEVFFRWTCDYNGCEYVPADASTRKVYRIKTYLKTVDGSKVVLSDWTMNAPFFLGAYISYPDPRAYKMEIIEGDFTDAKVIKTFALKPHPSLNISYYINDGMDSIHIRDEEITITEEEVKHIDNTYVEPNKIKVSEVNNPFLFPSEHTYQVGSGRILAESSIVMNVTDRNYGIYPVFVFTDEGVFTMQGQTSDTVHASIQAPAYTEPPVSNTICATPYGVLFITKRGLMLINQNGTELISPQLRESAPPLHIDTHGFYSPLFEYTAIPFTDFLKNVENMFYNPYRDEVIITNRSVPLNYVFDFATKSFYYTQEDVDKVVENAYPNLYVISYNRLKDFSEIETKSNEVAIVTRPLRFGTDDIKKMERVLLRSVMYNVNNNSAAGGEKMALILLHSQDGVNFTPTRGIKLSKNGNYKDFDMGLFARTKYRYYIFMLVGKMDEDSEIKGIEFEVDKEYLNEKMR